MNQTKVKNKSEIKSGAALWLQIQHFLVKPLWGGAQIVYADKTPADIFTRSSFSSSLFMT